MIDLGPNITISMGFLECAKLALRKRVLLVFSKSRPRNIHKFDAVFAKIATFFTFFILDG